MENLYDALYLSKTTEKEVLPTSSKLGWNHPEFDDVAFIVKEQDNFIISPFQVEEGVLTCPKCKCKRTFSYSKQTRSSDEPMTTFASCVQCRYSWTYSG